MTLFFFFFKYRKKWSIQLVSCVWTLHLGSSSITIHYRFTYTSQMHWTSLCLFRPRLTSTRVTWAGWRVSFLEGIIMWSRWNWKVQRTPWGCARWRSSVGKRAKASRFLDRSQPAWPSKRIVRLRLSECFASSPHRYVWILHVCALQFISLFPYCTVCVKPSKIYYIFCANTVARVSWKR